MNHQTFSWLHPDFNAIGAGNCSFYAIAGVEVLSYCVLGRDRTLRALRAWDFSGVGSEAQRALSAMRSLLATDDLYTLPYAERHCAISTPHTTLVPARFYQPNALPSYFNLLLSENSGEFGATPLPAGDIWAVYRLDREFKTLIEQFFQGAAFSHLLAAEMSAYSQAAAPHRTAVFVTVHGYNLQIAVSDRGQLSFYNTFRFDNPGDFLYFVLLAYEQTRLKPDEIPLFIGGNLLESGAIYRNLYRYIQYIHFFQFTGGVHVGKSVPLPNLHLFFDLFALAAEPSANQSV
jgi:hypothetical protein